MPDLMPRILLVEDDVDGRLVMADLLEATGYTVFQTEDCQTALAQIQQSPADLAVVDLNLPDGNGLDLIRQLQESHPSVISLISTGFSSMETAIQAVNEGAFAYLTKPMDPPVFLATLRQAADKWRLETQNRKLFLQMQAENDRVTALLQASEEINAATMNTSDLTRRIVQAAVRIMAARCGFIGLCQEGQICIREWWDGLEWHPLEVCYKEGEGGPGTVWQTHSTYRSSDVMNDPRLVENVSKTLRQKTMICCPILTRYGEILGVLDLSDKNGGEPFTEEDARFLEGLCRHVAVALENGRLYEEQRHGEEQRKQFYRDVVSAATRNKLILCDKWEMENPPSPPVLHMRVQEPLDIAMIRYAIEEVIRKTGISEDRLDGVLLCVGESVTNAYKHGGGGEVTLWLTDNNILIRVEDQGPGIDTSTLPRATLMPGFSTKASLGIGLTVILDFVDQARLSTSPEGTSLDLHLSIRPEEIDWLSMFGSLHDL